MTLEEADWQAAEAYPRAALEAVHDRRARDAKELTEDADEALFRVSLHREEARG